MTILVPGWYQGRLYLRILNQFKFIDNKTKKVGNIKVSLVIFFTILNIVNIAKTGPRSKMIDRVRYFGCLIKITKSHKKSFYSFLRRPYNEHMFQFSC